VIDALAAAANDPSAHGYPPFRGLPALREAIAARYSELYGVELMPHQLPNPRASWSSHRRDSAPWGFSLSCSQIATGALDWIEIVD
jgi:hypothetical protein